MHPELRNWFSLPKSCKHVPDSVGPRSNPLFLRYSVNLKKGMKATEESQSFTENSNE